MATKAKLLIKKKIWVPIVGPEWSQEQYIGETHVVEPKQALGKTVVASLASLTGDSQKQQANLKFVINKVSAEKLGTDVVAYILSPSSVKRLVRRSKKKMDDSFIAQSQDGKKVRLKYVLIAKGKAKGSVTAALRRQAREFLAKETSSQSLDSLFQALIQHRVQKGLSMALKKTYPLAVAELRWVELVKDEKTRKSPVVQVAEVVEPVKEEQPPVAAVEA